MNTDGGVIELEEVPVEYAVSQPQTTQVVMVQPQSQTASVVQQTPYQPVQVVTSQPKDDMATENYLYRNKVSDLTICHWIACLCCNCCNCALIGFVLNEFVTSAKEAGYYKLAFHTSEKAKCWMIAACICSLAPWIVFIILIASPSIIANSFSNGLTEDP